MSANIVATVLANTYPRMTPLRPKSEDSWLMTAGKVTALILTIIPVLLISLVAYAIIGIKNCVTCAPRQPKIALNDEPAEDSPAPENDVPENNRPIPQAPPEPVKQPDIEITHKPLFDASEQMQAYLRNNFGFVQKQIDAHLPPQGITINGIVYKKDSLFSEFILLKQNVASISKRALFILYLLKIKIDFNAQRFKETECEIGAFYVSEKAFSALIVQTCSTQEEPTSLHQIRTEVNPQSATSKIIPLNNSEPSLNIRDLPFQLPPSAIPLSSVQPQIMAQIKDEPPEIRDSAELPLNNPELNIREPYVQLPEKATHLSYTPALIMNHQFAHFDVASQALQSIQNLDVLFNGDRIPFTYDNFKNFVTDNAEKPGVKKITCIIYLARQRAIDALKNKYRLENIKEKETLLEINYTEIDDYKITITSTFEKYRLTSIITPHMGAMVYYEHIPSPEAWQLVQSPLGSK